jgi:hypothetical protein
MIAAVVALALMGVGCGGGDDSGADGGQTSGSGPAADAGEGQSGGSPYDRDACELLTGADIDAVLGEQVDGRFIPGDGTTSTPGQCEWASGEEVDLDEPALEGIVLFLGGEQLFENTRMLAERGDDYETFDVIGAEAYVGGGEGGVRVDEAGITVTPIGVDPSAPATHDLIVDLLGRVVANY